MSMGDYHAPTIVSGKLTAFNLPVEYGRFRAEPPRLRYPSLLSKADSVAVQDSPSYSPTETLLPAGTKGPLLILRLGVPDSMPIRTSYVVESACIV